MAQALLGTATAAPLRFEPGGAPLNERCRGRRCDARGSCRCRAEPCRPRSEPVAPRFSTQAATEWRRPSKWRGSAIFKSWRQEGGFAPFLDRPERIEGVCNEETRVTMLVTEMLRCEQKNNEFLLVTCDYWVTHASIVTMLGTRLVVSQCACSHGRVVW